MKIFTICALFTFLTSDVYFHLSAEQTRAALDVGSGQTKMVVAIVDEETSRPAKILYAEETPLLLGHDLKQSKEKRLSDHILAELELLLNNYRSIAMGFGADEVAGVATAVFRESQNGADFIKKIQSDLGINLQVISQEKEGEIGFLTAVAASGKNASEVIAWDSGGGSFQLSAESAKGLQVYQGRWGASKVVAAMIEQVQGLDFMATQTPNPVKIEEVNALRTIIQNSLSPLPEGLQEKLNDKKVDIVAVGGPYSPFKMAAIAIGKDVYTKQEIEKAIYALVGHSDGELANFPEPEMLIPRLTLIHAVMDHFGFDIIHYYETTGSTPGIFISPEFWMQSLVQAPREVNDLLEEKEKIG